MVTISTSVPELWRWIMARGRLHHKRQLERNTKENWPFFIQSFPDIRQSSAAEPRTIKTLWFKWAQNSTVFPLGVAVKWKLLENEKQFVAAQFPLVMSSCPVYFLMKPDQSRTQDAQFQVLKPEHRCDMWSRRKFLDTVWVSWSVDFLFSLVVISSCVLFHFPLCFLCLLSSPFLYTPVSH